MKGIFVVLVILFTALVIAFFQLPSEFSQGILPHLGITIILASVVSIILALPHVFILRKFEKDKGKAASNPDFRSELKIALNDAISAVDTENAEKVEEAIHKILNTLSKHNFTMERLLN